MQLKRELGLRVPRPTLQPRSTLRSTRRVAHVCFACRQSAKLAELPEQASHVGPTCRGPLHWMGWSFHVPPRDDVDEWTKVEILYARGFRFFSSGFEQGPPLPAHLRDLEKFLDQNPKHPLRISGQRRRELRFAGVGRFL